MRRRLFIGALAVISIALAERPAAKRETVANDPASIASLAESGNCREAIPLLKTALARVTDALQAKRLGVDGVHCAMSLDDTDTAGDFVRALKSRFPHDPEVLYLAVHVFSDMSLRASRELSVTAPDSRQMHEINAEALEVQGKPLEAIAEYREILKSEPKVRGIHYRIGRLLLSTPNSETARDEAPREFEQELEIDPSSAASEYVLGELTREKQQTEAAVAHFTRATRLDSGFIDAFIGLGRALLEGGRSADAIAPLQSATKLQPDNPAARMYLATAYQRSGRAEDARREFALQKEAAQKLSRTRQKSETTGAGPRQ